MSKKIKLNKSHRELIQDYGVRHIAASIDRSKEQKQLAILLEGANAAIRAKYPENDMVILRKYKLANTDRCIKFQFPSGRLDGFTFSGDDLPVDLPYKAGCHYSSNDVFPVSEKVETAYDVRAKLHAENDKMQQVKLNEFNSFLSACQYVDEVLDVIPLPEDIQKRLGYSSTALVAVSPETVRSLKATFKKAA